tara:strand:- start:38 stop:2092 length:2055 start_codon:yes stop_codon:yes gene_type:complete
MAKEILELEVKSNIKSVTTETKDWNKELKEVTSSIDLQKQIINEQTMALLELKKQQTVNSDWENAVQKLPRRIADATIELKGEKIALKGLQNEQKTATDAVKDFNQEQKEQDNLLKSGIGNFKVMGVSLNGVKKAFGKIIPTAKLMFGTIKAGLISTGIGALVVAFGTLMAWFTKTKVGAEALAKIFAGVGAAVSVIVDRITGFATAVGKLFSGDIKGALTGMKESFTGIGTEMTKEIALAIALKQSLQDLADSERELSVETAQRRAEIEDLKRKADDLNLTEEERIDALQRAATIEQDLMDKRVANAEEALRIQQGQMSMSNNMKEDLQELANLEINLANIRRESSTMQRTLQRKENAISKQVETQKKARHAAYKSRKAEERRIQNALITDANERLAASYIEQLSGAKAKELAIFQLRMDREEAEIKAAFKGKRNEEKREKLLTKLYTFTSVERLKITDKFDKIVEENAKNRERRIQDIENETLLMSISNERDKEDKLLKIQEKADLDAVENLVKKEEYIKAIEDKYEKIREKRGEKRGKQDKAVAKASTNDQISAAGDLAGALSSLAGDNKELAAASAIISTYVGANKAFAQGGIAGYVGAAAIIISGLANVKKIYAQDVGDGGGGGGGVTAIAAPPAPEMMSGAFELTGGQEVEPVHAYVVSDDITDSQNGLAIIRRRATI